jgi:hypothetical protein
LTLSFVSQALHDKVVAERFEFIHFVKQRCALTQDRYLLINPDVKKYIEEVWQVSVKLYCV